MRQHPILLYLLTALVIGLCLLGPILSAQGANPNANTEDMSTEDTTSEDMSSEDTYTEDATSEDMSSEDTFTEDTATEDVSIEDTSTEDTATDDTSIDDTSTSSATLAVTSPAGGEDWVIGTNQNITWTLDGATGLVRFLVSRDDGATWTSIGYDNANDGNHVWLVTGPATTSAKIKVVSATNSSVFGISDSSFTITKP